jgi:tetratricopeptide (TPR) repeat protein
MAVTAAIYANSLPGDFVFDDKQIVQDNPRLIKPSRWKEIWTRDYWARDNAPSWEARDLLYRPLALQTFAWNHRFGPSPWHFHVVNVLIYTFVTLGVWRLALQLFEDPRSAFLGAMIFAVHPIHTEAVANLVGRSELLCSGFMLAALICWDIDAARSRLGWAALGLLAAAGGLLSKETALCLAPTAVVLDLWRRRRSPIGAQRRTYWRSRALRCYAPFAVVLGLYLIVRFYACGGGLRSPLIHEIDNPLVAADFRGRVLGGFAVLGKYASIFVYPAQLCGDYSFNSFPAPDELSTPATMAGLFTACAVVASVAISWRRRRELVMLMGLFIFPYLLISNTFTLIGTIFAERIFFWPSLPLCLALGRVAAPNIRRLELSKNAHTSRGTRLLRFAIVAALVALAARTMIRNKDWASDDRFIVSTYLSHPRSARAQVAYGGMRRRHSDSLFTQGNVGGSFQLMGEAANAFEQAVAIYPDYPKAWLGVAHAGGRFVVQRGAGIAFQSLDRSNPPIEAILSAGAEWIRARPESELSAIRRAAKAIAAFRWLQGVYNQNSESLYYDLRSFLDENQFLEFRIMEAEEGLIQAFEGPDEVKRHVPDFSRLLPWTRDRTAIRNYARVRLESGIFVEAIPFYQRWLADSPRDPEAAIGLAHSLIGADRFVEAAQLLAQAVEENENVWQAHLHLGYLLAIPGREGGYAKSAQSHGKRAVELSGGDPLAEFTYARILAQTGDTKGAIDQYERAKSRVADNRWAVKFTDFRIEQLRRRLR